MTDFKKIIVIVAIFSSLIIFTMPLINATQEQLSLSANSAALYDAVGNRFLYTKNADQRLPMASTTKIMTAIIAIEELEQDKLIRIPKDACGIEGSSVYLREGDELTVRDLLYSLLLRSANDAAVALAYAISGDLYGFSRLMNNKALSIGLSNTNFVTPHGLDDEEHYTTARDLALLAAYAMDNDVFRQICSTKSYTFYIGEQIRQITNHNKLLSAYDGCIGVKTGYTSRSGRCLVSAAERDGIMLIAVTLKAPNDWKDHTAMLDHGFSLLNGR